MITPPLVAISTIPNGGVFYDTQNTAYCLVTGTAGGNVTAVQLDNGTGLGRTPSTMVQYFPNASLNLG